MRIERWDPFRDLMSIQGELNRLFGRTYGEGDVLATGSWIPPLDVFESGEKFVVEMELPGVDPEQVEVEVEDHTLTVSGKREFSREVKEESYHRIERRYGSFTRSVTLPATAGSDQIQATFEKGVLRIEVPKREEAKPKKITVKATA